MGFWSSVGSFISGCVSAIGSAISSVAGSIFKTLSAGLPYIGQAISIISNICRLIGSFKENDTVEEVGYKATVSDKSIEDFSSYDEYKAYIDKINLTDADRVKIQKNNDNYTSIGLALGLKSIDEKIGLGSGISFDTIRTFAALGLKADQVKSIIEGFSDKKLAPDIDKAVKLELPLEKNDAVLSTLKANLNAFENKAELNNKLDEILSGGIK